MLFERMLSAFAMISLISTAFAGITSAGADVVIQPVRTDKGHSAAIPEELGFRARLATQSDIQGFKCEWGVYEPGRNYNVVLEGHGTGDAPPTDEQYDALVGRMMVYEQTEPVPAWDLPAQVDLSASPYFPPVGDQQWQGSCAAWNIGYYCNGYLQRKDHNWTNGTNLSQLMSPSWVYNMNNYGVDAGTVREWNALLIASVGDADLAAMPYNPSDYRSWGSETAWRTAVGNRIEEYFDITDPWNTNLIKSWLSQGDVLSISFDADILISPGIGGDRTLSSKEYVHTSSNHAVTIVGYDDNRTTADGDCGAFKIANSWGKGWGGIGGFFWMTYDALSEITDRDIIRLHDKFGYEPALVATVRESTAGSRDSRIDIGTDSGKYAAFTPFWNAHQAVSTVPLFPAFMAFDITELSEDIGLTGYWLKMDTGRSGTATLSSVGLEYYPCGYQDNSTVRLAYAYNTPKTAPATVNISIMEDVHTSIESPANGTWAGGSTLLGGKVSDRIIRSVFSEDFEVWDTSAGWNIKDVTKSGRDYNGWATSNHRSGGGERAAWCSASDDGMVYTEDFNGGWLPSGWTVSSTGPNQYPFARSNSLARGCNGRDYVAVANSARGAGTNITEMLFMNVPVIASSHGNLTLSFYIDYDCNSMDEYAEVVYANGTTYPTFSSLVKYTSDTLGYRQLDLSFMDGEPKVFIGFVYHGTNDLYMAVDDVTLSGNKTTYDCDTNAYFEKSVGDISGMDGASLSYSYYLDSESVADYLLTYYRTAAGGAMFPLDNRTGRGLCWNETTLEVPLNATIVGFLFHSDGSGVLEGAFIDDLRLDRYTNLDNTMIKFDEGAWTDIGSGTNWSHRWDATAEKEGEHIVYLKANYSGAWAYSHSHIFIDHTPPGVSESWNGLMYTGDPTTVSINATDPRGIGRTELFYYTSDGSVLRTDAKEAGNGTWSASFDVPSRAIALAYRFLVEDGVGNSIHSPWKDVPVIDNDPPTLGNDSTPSFATTGDPLRFSTNVSDNIGLDRSSVEYWYGYGAHSTLLLDNNDFEATISVKDSLLDIHYIFSAVDTSGNIAVGEMRTIHVSDNDLPFLGDSTPSTATTGDQFWFSAFASDNIKVASLELEYWYGPSLHAKRLMGRGPDYRLQLRVPDTLQNLTYILKATDSSGNVRSTAARNVISVDNDPPALVEDDSPSIAYTGRDYQFNVRTWDNIMVRTVVVDYRFGDSQTTKRIIEDGQSIVIRVPEHSLDGLAYSIRITDSSGNVFVGWERTVPVRDAIPPVILLDGSDSVATTGDWFGFAVDAQDNIGIDGVQAEYWLDDAEPLLAALEGPFTFSGGLWLPDDATGRLHYRFIARDRAGNMNTSAQWAVDIKDNDAPRINEDGSISDNVGLSSVAIVKYYQDGTPTGTGTHLITGREYSLSENIRSDLDLYSMDRNISGYMFIVTDTSGNIAESGIHPTNPPILTVSPGAAPSETAGWLPLGLGLLAVILAVLLVVAVFYARKRSGQSRDENDAR